MSYNYRNYISVIACCTHILQKLLNDSMLQHKPRYDYTKNFWKKKRIAAPPRKVCTHKLYQCFFLILCIFRKNFCAISFTISRDMTIKKFWKKQNCISPLQVMYKQNISMFFLTVCILCIFFFYNSIHYKLSYDYQRIWKRIAASSG